jgi:transposase
MVTRRKFTSEYKARIVLEMLTGQKSAAQASREYGIKDSVLSRWKQEFIERSPMLFETVGPSDGGSEQRIAELERMIGRLALELEMAKKVSRFLNSPSNKNGS